MKVLQGVLVYQACEELYLLVVVLYSMTTIHLSLNSFAKRMVIFFESVSKSCGQYRSQLSLG